MSAPLYISGDDLREQENFNYSAIDQFWQEKGYTDDNLPALCWIIQQIRVSFGFDNYILTLNC